MINKWDKHKKLKKGDKIRLLDIYKNYSWYHDKIMTIVDIVMVGGSLNYKVDKHYFNNEASDCVAVDFVFQDKFCLRKDKIKRLYENNN